MIQPKPSFDFDASTLRDAKAKQRFDALLARAQDLRTDGAFVSLATNRALLAELEICYSDNVAQYISHYLDNKKRWRSIRESLALQKHDIHLDTYQQLLASMETVEAYLLPHDYAENAKAAPLLDAIEAKLQQAIGAKKSRKAALHQFRLDLKKAMETVWAEDYAPLKDQYKALKSGKEASEVIQLDSKLVAFLSEKRTSKIEQSLEEFKKNKSALKALAHFKSGYAYERDFDVLVLKKRSEKKKKKALIGALVVVLLALGALVLWKAPEYIRANSMQKDFERAKHLDNWNAYSTFIEEYPSSPLVDKAKELRGLLDYGEIEALVLSTGDTVRYEGQLDAGTPDGSGKAIFPTGQIYDGSWRAGMKEGQGTLTYPDGGEFVGVFDNNKKEKGILRMATGAEYSGVWENDKLDGDGSARWPDGSRYTGTWKNGVFSGYGTLKAGIKLSKYIPGLEWNSGEMYTGTWKSGLRDGHGTFSYSDGRVFVGEWKENIPDGRPGTLKWKDGSYFRGIWENGFIKGEGVFIDRFGNDFNGYWEGSPENITRKILQSGKIEKGSFVQGKFVPR